VQDIDLQDMARRDDSYEALNKIVDSLKEVNAFPSLTWVYVWDIIKDKLDYYHPDMHEEYAVNPAMTEKDVFDLLWQDADDKDFSLEYGGEHLHEAILDWMIEREILVVLDEDGWLE
jgi:hypothetical protein